MSSTRKLYYPAIDGIRALAVLAVIFFHLELAGFTGGYVGVDIFFVISGFLITRNILFDVSNNNFSFKRFYIARFRRLGPAMLVTIAITLLFGILLLSPDALIRLSGSAIASVVSLANVRFWQVSGYFDVDASLKPLLHFWSLSVEEQFYLFWPFILVFSLRLWPGRIQGLVLIIGLLLASFIGAQLMLASSPSTAFFWVQFRAYEFAFGALLAWLELRSPTHNDLSSRNSNALCSLGLVLIAYSVVVYTKDTPFPGYSSLAPCVGAFLLLYTRESRLASYLLANAAVRMTGRISYSLYLVHWPVWVYASHWWFKEFNLIQKAGLLVLILILGYALHFLVEKRFRYAPAAPPANSGRSIFIVSAVGAMIIVATAMQIRQQDGWSWRIKNQYPELAVSQTDCRDTGSRRHQDCVFGDRRSEVPRVLLVGDSHSMNLRHGLDVFGRQNQINFRSLSFAGCPPLLGVELHYNEQSGADPQCLDFADKIRSELKENQYEAVILSSRWMWHFEQEPYAPGLVIPKSYLQYPNQSSLNSQVSRQVWKDSLAATISKMLDSVERVVVFSQYPLLSKGIGECDKAPDYLIQTSRNHERCTPQVSYKQIMQRLEYTNATISNLQSKRVMIFKPSDYLCDHTAQVCTVLTERGLLYMDEHHLSNLGSDVLIASISEDLAGFLK